MTRYALAVALVLAVAGVAGAVMPPPGLNPGGTPGGPDPNPGGGGTGIPGTGGGTGNPGTGGGTGNPGTGGGTGGPGTPGSGGNGGSTGGPVANAPEPSSMLLAAFGAAAAGATRLRRRKS